MTRSYVRRSLAVTALFAALAVPAHAQTVSPGMSRDEVVKALGTPSGERTSHGYTYLFFRNGCERTCGMSDLVTLEDGQVSDAVFRKPGRSYSGRSSSPAATTPSATRGGRGTTLDVPSSRPVRRTPAGRARGAGTSARSATDPSTAGQTPTMVVPPRRAEMSAMRGDSVAARRSLQDTTTATGTRFGAPLSIAPGARTPQTPGIGAPPSRDSSVRNGVPLPPGATPVPFQGAKPSSIDSARMANERPRTP